MFSNVVVTSHSSCVFLYLFSSANISPVRFVLHLQDWWCVGKRETSFFQKLLIFLQFLSCGNVIAVIFLQWWFQTRHVRRQLYRRVLKTIWICLKCCRFPGSDSYCSVSHKRTFFCWSNYVYIQGITTSKTPHLVNQQNCWSRSEKLDPIFDMQHSH